MSATFDKLIAQLKDKGTLSNDDITAAAAASGEMTPEEHTQLEAERHKLTRTSGKQITMDEYLAASKILDTAAEGSEEYKKAEAIVNAYESGG